jgi:hypothetical protein
MRLDSIGNDFHAERPAGQIEAENVSLCSAGAPVLLAQEARFAGERGEQKKILAELLGRKQGRANKNCSERQEGCIERTPAPETKSRHKKSRNSTPAILEFRLFTVEYPELPRPPRYLHSE